MIEHVSVATSTAPAQRWTTRRPVRTLMAAFAAVLLASGLGLVSAPGASAAPAAASFATDAALGQAAVEVAAQNTGIRYRRGGTSPERGFDCSGYVQYVYAQLGVDLPRTSRAMRAAVTEISGDELQAGDLVFVHRGRRGTVSHVAIYDGQGGWYEATRPGRANGLHAPWTGRVSYGRI